MVEILFLVHRAPWPPDRGDRIRSWHMVQALAKLAPVHVAALADNAADAAAARAKMGPLCKSLCIEVRKVSRAAALVQAVLRGDREAASREMRAHLTSSGRSFTTLHDGAAEA